MQIYRKLSLIKDILVGNDLEKKKQLFFLPILSTIYFKKQTFDDDDDDDDGGYIQINHFFLLFNDIYQRHFIAFFYGTPHILT